MAYRCDFSILGLDAGVIVLMAPDAEKLGFPLIVWKTHAERLVIRRSRPTHGPAFTEAVKAEAAQAVTAVLQSCRRVEKSLLSDGGESRGCALGSSGRSVSRSSVRARGRCPKHWFARDAMEKEVLFQIQWCPWRSQNIWSHRSRARAVCPKEVHSGRA